MTEHVMQPGDTLTVEGETWEYLELVDQLAIERCAWGGHGPQIPAHRIAWAREARAAGRSRSSIAAALGVTERTVARYVEPPEVRQRRLDYQRARRQRAA